MSIQSVSLENFTVFDNIGCEFSTGINILIGENGTGKTHLLKAMYALCNTSAKNYGLTTELRSLFNSNPLIKGVINRKLDSPVKLHAQIDGKDYDYTLSISDDKTGYTGTGTPLNTEIFSTFIPAKEMLSISNITRIDERFDKELAMDTSLLNIIKKAQSMKLSKPPQIALNIAPKLESIIDGTVFVKENDNTFWIRKTTGEEILFAMEAEGVRKFALLWQLLMNGSLAKGTVLFWDEPEANVNPKLIPVIADILMELARHGVQVFLATHEYNLMKCFSIKKKDSDNISFISLYKQAGSVVCEIEDDYNLLEHNAIVEANTQLLEADIEGVF